MIIWTLTWLSSLFLCCFVQTNNTQVICIIYGCGMGTFNTPLIAVTQIIVFNLPWLNSYCPVWHPSSPARFKRSKTVKVRKFPLFKNLNKTPLFRRGYTATTARAFWHPGPRRVSPFQNIPSFIFIPNMPYHRPFNFTCPLHPLLTHVQRL